MKQIYTKTGDTGLTSLRGGVRVPKDDIRIETNGQIDHLNALLGIVRANEKGCRNGADSLIYAVQRELMIIMSHIATPDGEENPKPLHTDQLTDDMEQAIDSMTADRTLAFVIPGDTLPSAFVHLARTQCRTVERRLWALQRQHTVSPTILTFFNRLSDYLFALSL
ncbi:MAG: cob(I)yrinic acid a,c-diamide adenosyltransferase [Prevotella sp.]|nr:cob(I)yrinic acid a,c-diamide adenosyltransferase [Prevotella sp.]